MKRIHTMLALAGAAVLTLSTGQLAAQERGQGRGNFDPEQFRQRIMERYREQLEVKSDDEWKLIEGRIQKVMEARRDTVRGGGPGFFGRGGGPGGPGGPGGRGPGGDGNEGRRGGDQGRRGFGPEPSPEAEALQKAIDDKASADVLKSKLAAYRDSRKASQAKLEAAQKDLRSVLSVRQEATAVLNGLLD